MIEATVEPVMVSSTSCQGNSAPGELRETVEATQRSLSELRLLLANEVTLDCPTDDKFLLKFLRAAKYRVDDAFQRIQKYFRARQRWPEVFSDLSPSTVNYETVVAQHRLVIVSKQVDPKGRIVGLTRMGSWNSAICPLTEFFRACIVLAEWSLLNEEAQVRGVVGVIDLKGLELSHIAHYTPSVIRMAAHIGQHCIPARVKAFYVINHSSLFNVLFATLKPFLKPKIVQRVHLLGHDLHKMHGVLPPEVIPVEFGGTFENFDCVRQEKELCSSNGYFESMCRYGYKEQ